LRLLTADAQFAVFAGIPPGERSLTADSAAPPNGIAANRRRISNWTDRRMSAVGSRRLGAQAPVRQESPRRAFLGGGSVEIGKKGNRGATDEAG
jgi:hypothetical protein